MLPPLLPPLLPLLLLLLCVPGPGEAVLEHGLHADISSSALTAACPNETDGHQTAHQAAHQARADRDSQPSVNTADGAAKQHLSSQPGDGLRAGALSRHWVEIEHLLSVTAVFRTPLSKTPAVSRGAGVAGVAHVTVKVTVTVKVSVLMELFLLAARSLRAASQRTGLGVPRVQHQSEEEL